MKHLKRGLSEHGPTWSLISGPALMPNFQILLSFFSWKRTRQKHWTEETPLSISRKFAFSYMICTAPSLTSPHIRYFLNCYIWRHKPHWQTCLSARLIMCGLLIKSSHSLGQLSMAFLESIFPGWFIQTPRFEVTELASARMINQWLFELLVKNDCVPIDTIFHHVSIDLWYLLSTTISHVLLDFSSWHRATEHLAILNKWVLASLRNFLLETSDLLASGVAPRLIRLLRSNTGTCMGLQCSGPSMAES